MLGALDPLADRQQRGKLVAGPAASPASLLSRGDAEAVGDFAQAQLLAAQVEGEHGVVGDGRASDCLGLRDMFSILTAAVALPVGFADGWRCIAARWAWRTAWRNWQDTAKISTKPTVGRRSVSLS